MHPLIDISQSVTSQGLTPANELLLANTCQVDKREWWLWFSAIFVTLLLALGIASFTMPALFSGIDSLYAVSLDHTVHGLIGLVLIFDIYIVYEQLQINRIRQQFTDGLYRMAVLDPLTGLFNRRYILHRLEEEVVRCQRRGSPLVVITFDLDSFKRINDEHGHAVGDCVLRTFGEQLKRSTRGSDVVARYGGDEFLAVLPDCTVEQTHSVLNRLDDLLVQACGTNIRISYSAGWADYVSGESLHDLLRRADDRLYMNKAQ